MHEENVECLLHLGDLVEEADSDEQWRYVLDQALGMKSSSSPSWAITNPQGQGDKGEICFQNTFPVQGVLSFSIAGLNF